MYKPSDVPGAADLDLPGLLGDLVEIYAVLTGRGGRLEVRGKLLLPSQQAYAQAAERLRPLGYTPLFRREGHDDSIQLVPVVFEPRRSRPWVNALLFGLTVLSVLFVGQMVSQDPAHSMQANVLAGVAFAATLLAILGAHELGHYFVGRLSQMPVTLPYFIPFPFPPFGTMGAFIQMKAPPRDRRGLLAMAAAGPLAGLAVALPLLVLGLKISTVGPLPPEGALLEGNSLLYAAVKFLLFGRLLPGGGVDVNLHPVAFAAWAGLFLTGLNLVPAGQLDGGHIAYVLLGQRARYLSLIIPIVLVPLGIFLWQGWLLWAALIFMIGRTFATPLDGITSLDGKRTVLAVVMLILFALTFVPIPLQML